LYLLLSWDLGGMMSKTVLIIVGIILAILGILALFPAILTVPMWLAVALIVVGILCVIVGIMDKKRAA